MAFRRGAAIGLAVFFAIGVLLSPRPSHAGFFSVLARIFGVGPAEVDELPSVLLSSAQTAAAASAVGAENRPPVEAGGGEGDAGGLNVVQENALLAPLNPVGTLAGEVPLTGQIFLYTVRPGDTLVGIAKSFDVSANTILWANGIPDRHSLKVGDQLVILPVSGVKHEVKKGETVAAVAKRYRASIEDVLRFNGLAPDEPLAVGSILMVPNGELVEAVPISPTPRPRATVGLPLYEGYYLRPISSGRRSRGIHGYNGVDLADTCGLPVLAAADGQVLVNRAAGWNGGYGRYIVISHPNRTQTLYGHLKELLVRPGQSVRQGEAIGTIGSSGNSTGCHVHFEIRGARNPF